AGDVRVEPDLALALLERIARRVRGDREEPRPQRPARVELAERVVGAEERLLERVRRRVLVAAVHPLEEREDRGRVPAIEVREGLLRLEAARDELGVRAFLIPHAPNLRGPARPQLKISRGALDPAYFQACRRVRIGGSGAGRALDTDALRHKMLFLGLSDAQLQAVAGVVRNRTFRTGEVVVR